MKLHYIKVMKHKINSVFTENSKTNDFHFKLYDCKIELSQFQFDVILNLKMSLRKYSYI